MLTTFHTFNANNCNIYPKIAQAYSFCAACIKRLIFKEKIQEIIFCVLSIGSSVLLTCVKTFFLVAMLKNNVTCVLFRNVILVSPLIAGSKLPYCVNRFYHTFIHFFGVQLALYSNYLIKYICNCLYVSTLCMHFFLWNVKGCSITTYMYYCDKNKIWYSSHLF